MKHKKSFLGIILTITLFMGILGLNVHAQEDIKAEMKKDKTGTNPMNFTYDARLYNEFQWLNTAGDGDQNITTFEFRAPFAGGKWQFRGKIKALDIDADFNNDGISEADESGFGDMELRFMTIPYMKKMAVATLRIGSWKL